LLWAGFSGWGKTTWQFPSLNSRQRENNKWYLVLNTSKEALKTAPGFTYDKTRTAWIPAAKLIDALRRAGSSCTPARF